MTATPCPACGADTADGLLCARCVGRLRRDLEMIARLWRQLDVTLSRQARTGSGGKRTDPSPLPIDAGAFKVRSYVKNQLVGWAIELDLGDLTKREHGCWCKPYEACRGWRTVPLGDSGREVALWLSQRVERVRAHADAADIVEEFDYCAALVQRAVDTRASAVYCGACETCGADLMARPGATDVVCQRCERAGVIVLPVDVATRRDEMLAKLEHQWATVATCALVLAQFGLKTSADTVQNWAREKLKDDGTVVPPKLRPRGLNSAGHRLYRIGDVADLALDQVRRRAAREVVA